MSEFWNLGWIPLGLTSDWLVAQSTAEPSWVTILTRMDVAKLAILMVFGTGMIGAIGYAISSVIRAYSGAPDEADNLDSRITAIEQRLQQLERKL